MLHALAPLFGRAVSAVKAALPLSCALLALSSIGCASIVGEQTAETKFLVKPQSDSTFWGWSEITVEQDANSVDRATLNAVSVEPMEGSPAEDMTFLQNVLGEAVTSTARTKLVEETSMPPGEHLVSVDVVYKDDLRGFFEDGHTIRVEWSGNTNPSYVWPDEGIWIRVRVFVEIE
jgi:hypothetical protein